MNTFRLDGYPRHLYIRNLERLPETDIFNRAKDCLVEKGCQFIKQWAAADVEAYCELMYNGAPVNLLLSDDAFICCDDAGTLDEVEEMLKQA